MKKLSSPAHTHKTAATISPGKYNFLKYRIDTVKQKRKPILAANILGPGFTQIGLKRKIFPINFDRNETGLMGYDIKPRIKKSIARIINIQILCRIIPEAAKKRTRPAPILIDFSFNCLSEIGQEELM